jgi:hypothetical protein
MQDRDNHNIIVIVVLVLRQSARSDLQSRYLGCRMARISLVVTGKITCVVPGFPELFFGAEKKIAPRRVEAASAPPVLSGGG